MLLVAALGATLHLATPLGRAVGLGIVCATSARVRQVFLARVFRAGRCVPFPDTAVPRGCPTRCVFTHPLGLGAEKQGWSGASIPPPSLALPPSRLMLPVHEPSHCCVSCCEQRTGGGTVWIPLPPLWLPTCRSLIRPWW